MKALFIENRNWPFFFQRLYSLKNNQRPLVSSRNDVREMTAEIPYWWRVTTQIWLELLIGWNKSGTIAGLPGGIVFLPLPCRAREASAEASSPHSQHGLAVPLPKLCSRSITIPLIPLATQASGTTNQKATTWETLVHWAKVKREIEFLN